MHEPANWLKFVCFFANRHLPRRAPYNVAFVLKVRVSYIPTILTYSNSFCVSKVEFSTILWHGARRGCNRSMQSFFELLPLFAQIVRLFETITALKVPIGTEVWDYHLESAVEIGWFSSWRDHRLCENKSEHGSEHDLSSRMWTRLIVYLRLIRVTGERWQWD